MPLVEVEDGRLDAELAQRADAADAEYELLAEPVPAVAAVEAVRDRAGPHRVGLDVGVEEVEGNPVWARSITDRLYGGDRRHRLRQELVLGVGGVRALRELGVEPTVFHL